MISHLKFESWRFFSPHDCLTPLSALRNCIKLEVQTTIFSLGRMVSSTTDNNNINWQCLFCILLAQLTATYDLYTILSRAKKLWAGVSMCILPPENRDVSRSLSDTFHTFHYFPRVVYFDVFLIFCFFGSQSSECSCDTFFSGNGESSTRVAVGDSSQVLETAVREILGFV